MPLTHAHSVIDFHPPTPHQPVSHLSTQTDEQLSLTGGVKKINSYELTQCIDWVTSKHAEIHPFGQSAAALKVVVMLGEMWI